jgi:hypothetical protein
MANHALQPSSHQRQVVTTRPNAALCNTPQFCKMLQELQPVTSAGPHLLAAAGVASQPSHAVGRLLQQLLCHCQLQLGHCCLQRISWQQPQTRCSLRLPIRTQCCVNTAAAEAALCSSTMFRTKPMHNRQICRSRQQHCQHSINHTSIPLPAVTLLRDALHKNTGATRTCLLLVTSLPALGLSLQGVPHQSCHAAPA